MRFTLLFLILAGTSVTAETEIHRCLLDDGTFAFQETPCLDTAANADDGSNAAPGSGASETPAPDDDVFDFANPFDAPASPPTPVETTLPDSLSKDREECEKRTRDAIDAIDLELQAKADAKEQSREHLAELLELTRQLRACKQL